MKEREGFSRRAVLRSGAIVSGALVAGSASGVVGARPGEGRGNGRGSEQGDGRGDGRSCDLVVPRDYGSIQDAVDDADSGDTVCVMPGTYEETVTVDADVTVRGRTSPTSGRPAVVDGWVSLDAAGAELHRMVVTRTGPLSTPELTPDPFGVRVTASDTAVVDNVVRDLTDKATSSKWGAINGIQVFGNGGLSNVAIRGNEVRDTTKDVVGGVAGVKLQADVAGVEVTENAVTDLHSSGWVWGVVLAGSSSTGGYPKSVLVQDNTMDRLNDGSEYDIDESRDGTPYPGSAFGIDSGARADEATVRYNNLLAPNGAESKDETNALVAECNWWGAKSGPTHEDNPDGTGTRALERGAATIEYTPWLIAPSPSRACVGGTNRGNGRGRGP